MLYLNKIGVIGRYLTFSPSLSLLLFLLGLSNLWANPQTCHTTLNDALSPNHSPKPPREILPPSVSTGTGEIISREIRSLSERWTRFQESLEDPDLGFKELDDQERNNLPPGLRWIRNERELATVSFLFGHHSLGSQNLDRLLTLGWSRGNNRGDWTPAFMASFLKGPYGFGVESSGECMSILARLKMDITHSLKDKKSNQILSLLREHLKSLMQKNEKSFKYLKRDSSEYFDLIQKSASERFLLENPGVYNLYLKIQNDFLVVNTKDPKSINKYWSAMYGTSFPVENYEKRSVDLLDVFELDLMKPAHFSQIGNRILYVLESGNSFPTGRAKKIFSRWLKSAIQEDFSPTVRAIRILAILKKLRWISGSSRFDQEKVNFLLHALEQIEISKPEWIRGGSSFIQEIREEWFLLFFQALEHHGDRDVILQRIASRFNLRVPRTPLTEKVSSATRESLKMFKFWGKTGKDEEYGQSRYFLEETLTEFIAGKGSWFINFSREWFYRDDAVTKEIKLFQNFIEKALPLIHPDYRNYHIPLLFSHGDGTLDRIKPGHDELIKAIDEIIHTPHALVACAPGEGILTCKSKLIRTVFHYVSEVVKNYGDLKVFAEKIVHDPDPDYDYDYVIRYYPEILPVVRALLVHPPLLDPEPFFPRLKLEKLKFASDMATRSKDILEEADTTIRLHSDSPSHFTKFLFDDTNSVFSAVRKKVVRSRNARNESSSAYSTTAFYDIFARVIESNSAYTISHREDAYVFIKKLASLSDRSQVDEFCARGLDFIEEEYESLLQMYSLEELAQFYALFKRPILFQKYLLLQTNKHSYAEKVHTAAIEVLSATQRKHISPSRVIEGYPMLENIGNDRLDLRNINHFQEFLHRLDSQDPQILSDFVASYHFIYGFEERVKDLLLLESLNRAIAKIPETHGYYTHLVKKKLAITERIVSHLEDVKEVESHYPHHLLESKLHTFSSWSNYSIDMPSSETVLEESRFIVNYQIRVVLTPSEERYTRSRILLYFEKELGHEGIQTLRKIYKENNSSGILRRLQGKHGNKLTIQEIRENPDLFWEKVLAYLSKNPSQTREISFIRMLYQSRESFDLPAILLSLRF